MLRRSSFMRLFLLTVLAPLLILLASSTAVAETMNFRVFTYYTKVDVMPIGFFKAPANIIYEKRGLAAFENVEIAVFLARGSVKATPQVRTIDGYTLLTFSDSSTIIYDLDIKGSMSESTQKNIYTGTGKLIKGTGLYKGIQGDVKIMGKGVTTFNEETKGDAYFDVIFKYTLSSK